MIVEHLEVGPLQSNCYILADDKESEAIVIDPGGDGNRILALLERKSWKVKMVLNTHAHFDHIAANAEVVNATEASLAVPRLDAQMMDHSVMQAQMYGLSVDPSPKPDILLEDGDTIELGDEKIEVLATPGHSPGGMSFKTS
ncbi:MAG: MBL fold metallo-hydrolase, partial [bacterium]